MGTRSKLAAHRRLLLITAGVGVIAAAVAAYRFVEGGGRTAEDHQRFVGVYCSNCHDEFDRAGGLTLEGLDLAHPEQNPETWEKVIRKLRVGMMPPSDAPKPPPVERQTMIAWLETSLDAAMSRRPDPGVAL